MVLSFTSAFATHPFFLLPDLLIVLAFHRNAFRGFFRPAHGSDSVHGSEHGVRVPRILSLETVF